MGGREVVSARPLPQLLVACWQLWAFLESSDVLSPSWLSHGSVFKFPPFFGKKHNRVGLKPTLTRLLLPRPYFQVNLHSQVREGGQDSNTSFLVVVIVQSLSRVRLFMTPWTAARQASLSITDSRRLVTLVSLGR